MRGAGLFGKAFRGVRDFAGGIPEKLMPTPGHVEGLLSPQDIGSARRSGLLSMSASLLSPGSSLSDGLNAARESYGGQMSSTMKLREAASEREAAQAQAAKKAELERRYPITPNMTREQAREMTLAYMQAGVPLPGGADGVAKLFPQEAEGFTLSPGSVRYGPDNKPVASVPRAPSEMSPYMAERILQNEFTREQGLWDDFSKATTKARSSVNVISDTLRDKDRALAGDPAAQVRVLYGFINSMDDTAVREGEMRLVMGAANLVDQARAHISRASTDANYAVPPQILRQMIGLMDRRLASNKTYLRQQEEHWQDVARRNRVDPSRFKSGANVPQESASPAAGGAPLAPGQDDPNAWWNRGRTGLLGGGFGATPPFNPNAAPARRNPLFP